MAEDVEERRMKKHFEGFTVIGITARTSNMREMGLEGESVIAKLWDRWFRDALFAKIPNQIEEATLALYYDYDDGRRGDYSYMIGVKVSGNADVPAGMVKLVVPPGEYRSYETDRGAIWDTIPAIWKRIWQEEHQGDLKRSYGIDFELFDDRAASPEDAVVEVWVGELSRSI